MTFRDIFQDYCRTKVIFQDFPGLGIFKEKIQNFPGLPRRCGNPVCLLVFVWPGTSILG